MDLKHNLLVPIVRHLQVEGERRMEEEGRMVRVEVYTC